MKLLRYLSCVMAVGLATMAWSQPPGKTPKVDIFSAPNAGANPWQGTYALGITSTGAVGGYYIDANGVNHGFIRSLDGTLTVVDVAAAGTGSGEGTQILAMNSLGAATGAYFANGTRYAFMRDPLGNLTLFDIPGALGSEGQNINNAGTSAGSYLDGSGVFKGFLRTQSGELVTYDIPGSCAWCFNVQNVPWNSMNQPGAIVGTFWDGTGAHGWIRSQKGLTNEFNAPVRGGGVLSPTPLIRRVRSRESWPMRMGCMAFSAIWMATTQSSMPRVLRVVVAPAPRLSMPRRLLPETIGTQLATITGSSAPLTELILNSTCPAPEQQTFREPFPPD